MVTFSELRDAKPQSWSTAADDFLGLAKHCEQIMNDIHHGAIVPLSQHWKAEGYDTANATLTSIANRTDGISMLCRTVMDAVDTLHYAIQITQSELHTGIAMARNAGLDVDSNGSVSFPPGDHTVNTESPARIGIQQEAQQLINNAIESATMADKACTTILIATTRAGITDVDSIAAANNGALIPDNSDEGIQNGAALLALSELSSVLPVRLPPKDVSDWWNGLTPQEQFDLERAVPVQLTTMIGIPTSVRKAVDRPQLGYSSIGTVQYAELNAMNSSIDSPNIDNCTNFVSHALKYGGGMTFQEQEVGDKKEVIEYWNGAQSSHDFFVAHGRVVQSNEVRPGDIMYLAYTNDDNADDLPAGAVHHAAVVTGVLPDNEVLYAQHTTEEENSPIYGRLPDSNQQSGQQNVIFVQPDTSGIK